MRSHRNGDAVPESNWREHLERVAGSATFVRAAQLRRLLQWLGERSAAADAAAPSEKEIAEAVLHRKDFDPQSDSLVRKEMSRLREKLSRYYLLEGARETVRIQAANGYLLSFRQTAVETGAAGACWLVLPFRAGAEMQGVSEDLLEEILIGLNCLNGPSLVAPSTALGYRGRQGDVRQFAAECHASLVVEGSLRAREGGFEALVWSIDGKTGRAIRSARMGGLGSAEIGERISKWLLAGERV